MAGLESRIKMSKSPYHIKIRNFEKKDRPAVRRISYETSFLGKADELFDQPELVADALTLYFTDNEPESCFVAVTDGKVVGYLIGAKDENAMSKVSWFKVYPRLIGEALIRGIFFKRKTFRFFTSVAKSFLKGEFKSPDFSAEFPAIFHINVAKEYRSGGIGHDLVDFYLEYLKKNKVAGVRVSIISDVAKGFFERCGFSVLFTTKRSYLRYSLKDDIDTYLLGKRLNQL